MNLCGFPDSKTYPDADRCIYCGSTDEPRTLEHIIPYALGGNLKYPKASCAFCQKMTWWAENEVLKKDFLAPRTHLKTRTSKPKKRPTRLNMGVFDNDGDNGLPPDMSKLNFRWVDLPIDEHPSAIMLPELPLPGLITKTVYGEGLTLFGLKGHIIRPAPPSSASERHGIFERFYPEALARMILKIAHGLAVAEMGSAFKPILPDFILRKRLDWNNVLGMTDHGRMKHDRLVHCSLHARGRYLLARIQLFAPFGFRPYVVVVGEIPGIEGYSYSFRMASTETL